MVSSNFCWYPDVKFCVIDRIFYLSFMFHFLVLLMGCSTFELFFYLNFSGSWFFLKLWRFHYLTWKSGYSKLNFGGFDSDCFIGLLISFADLIKVLFVFMDWINLFLFRLLFGLLVIEYFLFD